jgi:hypothetical protein
MKKYQKFIEEKMLILSKEKSVLDLGGGERF